MGCDIHFYAEYVDPELGEWVCLPGPGTGTVFDDYEGEHQGPPWRFAWDALESTKAAKKLRETDKDAASCVPYLKGPYVVYPNGHHGEDEEGNETYEDEYSLRDWWGNRNYFLFGVLTGGEVRHRARTPLPEPKGPPGDASPEIQKELERWGYDAHSHSYFTLAELSQYDWADANRLDADWQGGIYKTFAEGNPLIGIQMNGSTPIPAIVDSRQEGEDSYYRLENFARCLQEIYDASPVKDLELIRVVFWFDN